MHRMDPGYAFRVALLLMCDIVNNATMSCFTIFNQVTMFSDGALKFFLSF